MEQVVIKDEQVEIDSTITKHNKWEDTITIGKNDKLVEKVSIVNIEYEGDCE